MISLLILVVTPPNLSLLNITKRLSSFKWASVKGTVLIALTHLSQDVIASLIDGCISIPGVVVAYCTGSFACSSSMFVFVCCEKRICVKMAPPNVGKIFKVPLKEL